MSRSSGATVLPPLASGAGGCIADIGDGAGVPVPGERGGFVEMAPELAVEVVSPSNSLTEMHDKVLTDLETGVRTVLVVEPTRRTVTTVHTPDRRSLTLLPDETFDGGDVLPKCSVLVADLFQ